MKQSVHQYQGSLFTPTTTIVEHPKESPTTNPLTPPTPQPERLNIEITREALAAEIIQGLVEHRRWEKELTLGATDEELSTALGTCWASDQRVEIHCNIDPQPQLICTTTMGQELLRLNAPEIATLIRTHADIPTVPNEEERERRLKQHLDKERNKARNEIFTAVQSILGDKSRKRDQGFTQPFVDLLFTENCLQEENESATLETITSMLIARHWTRLKAMKTAIQLVERAAGTWRSIERYWLNRNF
jgi:hypothetical protein